MIEVDLAVGWRRRGGDILLRPKVYAQVNDEGGADERSRWWVYYIRTGKTGAML